MASTGLRRTFRGPSAADAAVTGTAVSVATNVSRTASVRNIRTIPPEVGGGFVDLQMTTVGHALDLCGRVLNVPHNFPARSRGTNPRLPEFLLCSRQIIIFSTTCKDRQRIGQLTHCSLSWSEPSI